MSEMRTDPSGMGLLGLRSKQTEGESNQGVEAADLSFPLPPPQQRPTPKPTQPNLSPSSYFLSWPAWMLICLLTM